MSTELTNCCANCLEEISSCYKRCKDIARLCSRTAYYGPDGAFYLFFQYSYEEFLHLKNFSRGDYGQSKDVYITSLYTSRDNSCQFELLNNYTVEDDNLDIQGMVNCYKDKITTKIICEDSFCDYIQVPKQCDKVKTEGDCIFCGELIDNVTCTDVVSCGFCEDFEGNCGAEEILRRLNAAITFSVEVRLYDEDGNIVSPSILNPSFDPKNPCRIWTAPSCHYFDLVDPSFVL